MTVTTKKKESMYKIVKRPYTSTNSTFIAGILVLMLVFAAMTGTAYSSTTYYAVSPALGSQELIEFNLDNVVDGVIEVTNSTSLTYNGEDSAFFTNTIAFSPTGELYGWSSRSNTAYEGMGQLYTIDTDTGEITMIGDPQGKPGVYGMTFDSDGTLYGLADQHLYTIDTTTGVRTQVGSEPIVDLNGGLAIDYATGELYAWTGTATDQDQLIHIDKTTGEATNITIDFDVEANYVGAEINPDTGEMLAIRGGSMVYSTNLETGEGEYIGTVMVDGVPISTHSLTTAAVAPEPVSSALFLVGGATLGFRRFRKKVKA